MCWIENTTNAISDTGRKESVLRWSLIGVSSVQFCQRLTRFSYISHTPRTIGDKGNLAAPPRSTYHRMFFFVFCNVHRRSFLSFPHLIIHSLHPRMIWILRTIPFLFRRLQWWIAVALLLYESRTTGVTVLPLVSSGLRMRETWLELMCPCPRGDRRVSPFYHPSIHQLSTLEKTKLYHRPTLSSVLSTELPTKLFVEVHWLVTCVTADNGLHRSIHISQLSHSKDYDFHSFSSLGFMMPKMT